MQGEKILFDIIPVVVVLVIFWFCFVFPSMQKEKRKRENMSKLRIGDMIVTRGGMKGRISAISDHSFLILSGTSQFELDRDGVAEILKDSNQQ